MSYESALPSSLKKRAARQGRIRDRTLLENYEPVAHMYDRLSLRGQDPDNATDPMLEAAAVAAECKIEEFEPRRTWRVTRNIEGRDRTVGFIVQDGLIRYFVPTENDDAARRDR